MIKSSLAAHSTLLRSFFFILLLIAVARLHAQDCSFDVMGTPCEGVGDPCVLDEPNAFCFEFVDNTIFFGATRSYPYSYLSSGALDFNSSDFIIDRCPSNNEGESRMFRARRRILNINAALNAENLCAEWEVVWGFSDGVDAQGMNAPACQYIVVQVIDDGGLPPRPQVKENLFVKAETYFNIDQQANFREDPADFLENPGAFVDHVVIDEPNLSPTDLAGLGSCTAITRTWGLTDWCGNQTTAIQEITLYKEEGEGCAPEVLEALYNATDGNNWTNNTNWLNGMSPCNPAAPWFGISCDAGGSVTQISLIENNLNGRIPAELGNLAGLEYIDLCCNQLSGAIPPELGNLSDLTALRTDFNQLSGSIPAELGNLNKLQLLTLNDNQLRCFEAGLDSLCDNAGLQVLVNNNLNPLDWNNFCATGVDTCGQTDALAALYNATDGANWTNNSNWLNGMDPCDPSAPWFGLTCDGSGDVVEINLELNGLNGFIPPEMEYLKKLTRLILFDNALGGLIPSELGAIPDLNFLDLGANQLSGPIPAELGFLNQLETLLLEDNQLSGAIPPELGVLINLGWVQLGGNQLSGSIPPELGNLVNLNYLDLGANQLSGSIPSHFGNLSRMETLLFDGNQLSGAVPAELGNLTNLQELTLFDNQFLCFETGLNALCGIPGISVQVGNNPGNLNWNAFCASGAGSCGESAALAAFYYATDGDNWNNNSNWLNGMDPCDPSAPWFGVTCDGSGRVTALNLDQNNLNGFIPAELAYLAELVQINFFINQLSGSIPSELSQLSKLLFFDLRYNQLTGNIPPELGDLSSIRTLLFSDNQLRSFIPPELSRLTNMYSLQLHNNRLIGEIPFELGDLVNLDDLLLSNNQLFGSIPPELGNLSNLINLRLADNQLEGGVPAELGNLNQLQTLTLDNNQLSCFEAGLDALCNNPNLSISAGGNPDGLDWNAFCSAGLGTCAFALEALYNATDGDNWTNKTNWLNNLNPCNPAAPWRGISCDEDGNITRISLFSNNLVGEIPPELGDLNHLTSLSLDNNQLEGAIPSELGNLNHLINLYLYENQLSGSIPPELGGLSNLEFLELDHNQLTGSIPPELGNLINLKTLYMERNQLSGSIPSELGGLTKLESIDLENNQLTGSIPPELGNLSLLRSIYFSNNSLAGSIPSELGNLSNLNLLRLANNELLCFEPGLAALCNRPGLTVSTGGNPGGLDWNAFCATGAGSCEGVQVSPVVYLQGSYELTSGLMRDNLRAGGILPLTEPFTDLGYSHLGGGGESVLPSVFGVDGSDAIVDWVLVELRDPSNSSVLKATRSALLQRGGDVVDVDGFSPVFFADLPIDDYYLVVRHRNHLGVMSAAPVALSSTTTVVDFTSDLNNVFGGVNGIASLSNGLLGLYSGDFNRNGQVQNTDYNEMIVTLGFSGYQRGDFDLNGQVQNTDLQLNLIPNIGRGQPFGQ